MIRLSTPAFENKIVARSTLASCVAQLARPVVFTNGVFDLLHRGHVTYLAQARTLGASLVVAINSDASVRKLGKGEDRPLSSEDDRAALVAALESVTLVTLFDEKIPLETLKAVRPEFYIKGGDYDMDTLPEGALVESWGGTSLSIAFDHDRSTTQLLTRLRAKRD
jgi:rfaE bifunctional protein nucleotidyltransferase chain/domain